MIAMPPHVSRFLDRDLLLNAGVIDPQITKIVGERTNFYEPKDGSVSTEPPHFRVEFHGALKKRTVYRLVEWLRVVARVDPPGVIPLGVVAAPSMITAYGRHLVAGDIVYKNEPLPAGAAVYLTPHGYVTK